MKFQSTMIEVNQGEPLVRSPVGFSGRVSEQQLEDWLIAHPELAGEDLLVLGNQLAEFAEDRDRLDVLAVDRQGELVLIEIKVDDRFRVTDLQALAYAGAYASVTPQHLVGVLRRHLARDASSPVPLEAAREQVLGFVGLDEFDEWEPSKRVRIKLLAPGFPRRVLKTVKWLGDVYGMPIEAIEVKLFEDSTGAYHLTIERLLPIQGDDAFDMTVRDREERKREQNVARRPAVLTSLVERGVLTDGATLWFDPTLYPDIRDSADPNDPVFRVNLDMSGAQPRFRWKPTADEPEEILAPASAWYTILSRRYPDGDWKERYRPVHNGYTTQPGGKTLGQIAEESGAWESSSV